MSAIAWILIVLSTIVLVAILYGLFRYMSETRRPKTNDERPPDLTHTHSTHALDTERERGPQDAPSQ